MLCSFVSNSLHSKGVWGWRCSSEVFLNLETRRRKIKVNRTQIIDVRVEECLPEVGVYRTVRRFVILLYIGCCVGDQVDDEVDWTCSTYGREDLTGDWL